MSLTGSHKLKDETKPENKEDKWIGEDDKNLTRTAVYKPVVDKNGLKGVALEPMRIRTFVIDYNFDAKEKA